MTSSRNAGTVQQDLRSIADPRIAEHSGRFFKSGPGEYGEGDKFLGIRVPDQRRVAKKYRSLSLDEIRKLLHSEYHEERLTALLILTYKYPNASDSEKQEIYDFYMSQTEYINNWDLVDTSAPKIVGAWLEKRPRKILYSMAESDNLWERRITIIATHHFIRKDDFGDTLEIADLLLTDDHDLIHKAVGWMLREVGNRNRDVLVEFLNPRYQRMPRTMLRYAIEKFPEELRQSYLNG